MSVTESEKSRIQDYVRMLPVRVRPFGQKIRFNSAV